MRKVAGVLLAAAIILPILPAVLIHADTSNQGGLPGTNTTNQGGNTTTGGNTTGGNTTTGGAVSVSLPNPLGDCNTADCLLVKILDAMWVLASLLTTFMILVGAFQMLTAAGNPEKIQTARKTITYAVIGFGIVILSYSASAIIKSVFESASGTPPAGNP